MQIILRGAELEIISSELQNSDIFSTYVAEFEYLLGDRDQNLIPSESAFRIFPSGSKMQPAATWIEDAEYLLGDRSESHLIGAGVQNLPIAICCVGGVIHNPLKPGSI